MIDWLANTIIASTLLMLAVLMVRRPFAHSFGPRLAYALWALPLFRLALPPLPGWTALYEPIAAFRPTGQPLMVGIVDPVASASLHAAAASGALPPHSAAEAAPLLLPTPDLVPVLVCTWALGALLWFGWQLLRYRAFLRRALAAGSLLTRAGGTDVLVTAAVAGPVAAGVFRRRIFLPADFRQRYTPAEQRLALLHEAAHHDRGDLVANFAGLAMVALHWWNPIAHIAWKAFRADQELACDATVLAGTDGGDRRAYGSAVLKSACTRTPAAACAMNQKSQLKQRIGMMTDRSLGPLRVALGCTLGAALIGGGLLLTAAGSAAQSVPPAAPAAPPAAPAAPQAPVAPAALLPPAAPERTREVRIITLNDKSGKAGPAHEMHRIVIRDGRVTGADTVAAGDGKGAVARADGMPASGKHIVRTIVMQDGKTITDDITGNDAGLAAIDREIAGKPDGKHRIVIERRITRDVQASLAAERRGMAARCTAAGTPVAADADMRTLATCGPALRKHIDETVRESLESARKSIETSRDLGAKEREKALAGLDKAMRDLDRNLDRDLERLEKR